MGPRQYTPTHHALKIARIEKRHIKKRYQTLKINMNTKDGVNKATADINIIFHKAAIKANCIKPKQKLFKRQKTGKWFNMNVKSSEKTIATQTTQPCQLATLKF